MPTSLPQPPATSPERDAQRACPDELWELGARAVERAGGTWESEPGGLDERADAWAERARRVAASRPR